MTDSEIKKKKKYPKHFASGIEMLLTRVIIKYCTICRNYLFACTCLVVNIFVSVSCPGAAHLLNTSEQDLSATAGLEMWCLL